MHLSGVLQSRNMSGCAGLRVNGTCGIVPLPSSQANTIITVTPLLGCFLPMRVVTKSDCPSSPRSALWDPTCKYMLHSSISCFLYTGPRNVPVGSKYEMVCENGHRLSVNRESRKYNIKERSDNIQLAFRNALYLAYMRARSKSRLASPVCVFFKSLYISPKTGTLSFVFRLSQLTGRPPVVRVMSDPPGITQRQASSQIELIFSRGNLTRSLCLYNQWCLPLPV
jgi:hypothetical protein